MNSIIIRKKVEEIKIHDNAVNVGDRFKDNIFFFWFICYNTDSLSIMEAQLYEITVKY